MPTVDRVFFVPWPRAVAQDFVDEAAEAEKKFTDGHSHHQRIFLAVCWDDPGTPLKDIGFAATLRVEVVGHGAAGSPYISNTAGPNHRKEYLPFSEVGDRLIAKGLPKRYAGALSCGVCYSAVSKGNNPSFADLLSRYLNHKGYLLLHTIGYMGPMNTVHEHMAGHKYHHRPVDLERKDGSVKTVKTSSWAAWKHYGGLWSVPNRLSNLPIAYDTRPVV